MFESQKETPLKSVMMNTTSEETKPVEETWDDILEEVMTLSTNEINSRIWLIENDSKVSSFSLHYQTTLTGLMKGQFSIRRHWGYSTNRASWRRRLGTKRGRWGRTRLCSTSSISSRYISPSLSNKVQVRIQWQQSSIPTQDHVSAVGIREFCSPQPCRKQPVACTAWGKCTEVSSSHCIRSISESGMKSSESLSPQLTSLIARGS